MEEQFVTYEIALKLKELGFNEKCFGYFGIQNEVKIEISYNSDLNLIRRDFISAPLWQQVIDWLIEKHGIIIGYMNVNIHTNLEFMWCISTVEEIELNLPNKSERCFKDYQKAREQAILKAIELCKK